MAADVLKTALVQLTSGPVVAENLDRAEKLIRQAAAQGAKLVVTPENTDVIRQKSAEKLKNAFTAENHPGIPRFAALARELNIWLLIGSMAIKVGDDKMANRSHLFSPDGALNQSYDKIHLFDVTLSDTEFYRESEAIQPGGKAVLADIDGTKLGMSICYDIRFPQLFRKLAKGGAQILTVPAAFTVPTGQAHWEVLLRARAIENGAFVLAAAQVGEHEGGRKTYGHSMIVAPWGEVIAQKESGEGILLADLDLTRVEKARSAVPALTHDRDFEL